MPSTTPDAQRQCILITCRTQCECFLSRDTTRRYVLSKREMLEGFRENYVPLVTSTDASNCPGTHRTAVGKEGGSGPQTAQFFVRFSGAGSSPLDVSTPVARALGENWPGTRTALSSNRARLWTADGIVYWASRESRRWLYVGRTRQESSADSGPDCSGVERNRG
jgi:hypothetical protein